MGPWCHGAGGGSRGLRLLVERLVEWSTGGVSLAAVVLQASARMDV